MVDTWGLNVEHGFVSDIFCCTHPTLKNSRVIYSHDPKCVSRVSNSSDLSTPYQIERLNT